MNRYSRTAALLALAAAVCGCGSAGTVEGQVTYRPNGKKVVWGNVVVFGADNIPRPGMINRDGSYLVKDVPTGDFKVCVSSENPKPSAGGGQKMARPGSRGEERRAAPETPAEASVPVDEEIVKGWFAIPAKYGDPAQTPLKHTARGPKTTFDIVLD